MTVYSQVFFFVSVRQCVFFSFSFSFYCCFCCFVSICSYSSIGELMVACLFMFAMPSFVFNSYYYNPSLDFILSYSLPLCVRVCMCVWYLLIAYISFIIRVQVIPAVVVILFFSFFFTKKSTTSIKIYMLSSGVCWCCACLFVFPLNMAGWLVNCLFYFLSFFSDTSCH